mmetsp:Transcript_2333/g.5474  ORF Transcript_2333/g.5474 Transcript_2333/m.5474 type:complete len:146 (+) Transcript_2333:1658-2095(+)
MGGNRSFGPRCIYLSGGRLSFSNRGACEIVSFWFGPTATCVAGSLIREVSGIANMAVTAPSSEDTSARMLVGDGDVIIRGSRQQYSTSRLAERRRALDAPYTTPEAFGPAAQYQNNKPERRRRAPFRIGDGKPRHAHAVCNGKPR